VKSKKRLLVVFVAIYLSGCGSVLGSDPEAGPTSSQVSPTSTQPAPKSTSVPPTITKLPPSKTPLPPTPTQIQPTATPAPPGDPVLGDEWGRPTDDMVMSFIPAGEFEMGSTESNPCGHLDEFPQHIVYLDGYWIDQTQVTSAQYRRCVDNEGCEAPASCGWGAGTYDEESKVDHPVVCVTWEEARTYCAWAGGRLPTEAQWEKAAQGGDGRAYPWGEEFDAGKCNSGESGINEPTPVRLYSPGGDSPYGLADMAGNVWEWMIDWYDIDYYAKASSQNPTGPAAGDRKALRGGSYYGDLCNARTTYRYYDIPYGRGPGVGFRCVWPTGG
jgi:formylglycine-generating enzyme required for sulfatase activity